MGVEGSNPFCSTIQFPPKGISFRIQGSTGILSRHRGILIPMIKISLKEAEGHLGELIEEAVAGQEVVITIDKGPAVRLTLVPPDQQEGPESRESRRIGPALDRYIGTWSADQEAEVLKAVEIFEQVDESFWR